MRALLLILLLALTGCASVAPSPVASTTQREVAAFNLNGRFAVHHQDKHYSGGMRWQHEPARDELLLQGPLGITAARIVSDAQAATLEQNGRRYEDGDVESLMRQVLGWGLPLPVLHHWIMGAAEASIPAAIERDATGRIALLYQAGWEVRYVRYADDSAGSLPSRITLKHEDLEVQLLLDEWEFDPK
ncbi:MAG: lipoprotein insertase outer membrane protein LolB [Gallionella sp.]